jgi:signal transduction histidine kinase
MGFRRAVAPSIGLVASGVVGVLAWQRGLWGLLTGTLLIAVWLTVLGVRTGPQRRRVVAVPIAAQEDGGAHRLMLDAVPTPMLTIDGKAARCLNRAARQLFATDDRVLPPPAGLVDPATSHVAYEGRRWRVDRVVLGDGLRMVVALIDIEREERAAEARATAEMIHVLGHELLNGLAPIASLAESGLEAVERADADPALLREVLGTLARRAEGLQRFTEAYRALARLPEPRRRAVAVGDLTADLARLFAGRWPRVALSADVSPDLIASIDGDQLGQAIWALLQNAAEAGADRVWLTAAIEGSALVIAVRDDGPGIDPAKAPLVFRPFHTTKAEGSGVGLSLARQIALAHGGALTLEPGTGARFRLTLPL